jgi:NAD-dependent DNA ligase
LLTLLDDDVDRDQPFPGVFPGKAVEVLHGEAVTSVTDLEVSAKGMLRVHAVVPEMADARGIVRPLRSNAGDLGVQVGDRIAIGWDSDGRLHLGSVLTSLRTGRETSPELSMQCSSCGTAFEPFTFGGWRCPNEQYCPTLVAPRLDKNLALAPRMRQERLDIDRHTRRRAVVRRLLATRLVRNEGDLYAPSDDAVIEAMSGLPAKAVREFLEDRRVSRERPFAATVALIPRVEDGDAQNLVRKFSTLDRLLTASIDELYEGLLDGRDDSRRPAPRYRPEGHTEWLREEKHRLAEEVRDWLHVPWHVEVLRQMQRCGVRMSLEPGETWPPTRSRSAHREPAREREESD